MMVLGKPLIAQRDLSGNIRSIQIFPPFDASGTVNSSGMGHGVMAADTVVLVSNSGISSAFVGFSVPTVKLKPFFNNPVNASRRLTESLECMVP